MKVLGLTCLLFLKFLPGTQTESNWKLKKVSEGITVYVREIEGSPFKELKSSVQIKTSLSSIVSLLNDWQSYPQWVYRCEQSKTLKIISPFEIIHYQSITAPWPVDNRDFVVKVKLEQDPLSKIVTQKSSSIPDYIVPAKDHVRITQFKAEWILSPLKNGMVNIEYRLLVDPGGTIPVWLVNLAMVEGPFETMLNMKTRVMLDKYQKAKMPGIID
ncbi:MAG: START domain-containing protein [Bacteroidota bacterium]|nr:START domain-containing protein [Bacteroidota bacterium]